MSAGFSIEGNTIGPGCPVFIVAEIGVNHGGDEEVAAMMVEAAARAGADAVKLQTVEAGESYLPGTDSYREFQNKALPLTAMRRLNGLAERLGVILFSTPGGFQGLRLMLESGMRLIKISSGQITNLPLVRAAGATGFPLILSTGMAYLHEVREALHVARKAGAHDLAVLQCTSLYPAPAGTLNLPAIRVLAMELDVPVGYSDHHLGDLACLAAVAAGACILEKHFTLDRSWSGADHAISLEPDDFAGLVEKVRTVEVMLGGKEKAPTVEETPLRPTRYRYLVAIRSIAAGEILDADAVGLMRVGSAEHGLIAARYDDVVGRRARTDITVHQLIRASMVEGLPE